MKYLHTMVRVRDIDASLNFYCNLLGLKEARRKEYELGKFTLIFLAPPNQPDAMIELTYNWDSSEVYTEGRNFGHLAFEVDDIEAAQKSVQSMGVETTDINTRNDGQRVFFINDPEGNRIEICTKSGFGVLV